MKRQQILVPIFLVSVLFLPSCSGNKTKKGAEPPKPAPAAEKKNHGGEGTANPASGTKSGAGAATTIPVKKRAPAELLAAIPCKLAGKSGVFAVFPDNQAAGQVCFGLYPARGNEVDIPKFDIRGGGIHIISHYTAGGEPGAMKLMKWEERGGKPCLEAACGNEIPVKRETFSAPGESGWTYIIITPEKTVDFGSVTGGYIGLVMGADKYIPLFH
ncbi:MAG: hypothetical protein AB1546_11400 [bacterium]